MNDFELEDMVGQQPFFTDWYGNLLDNEVIPGIGGCDWSASQTHLYAHKDEIVRRFNLNYKFREIGLETPSLFQHYLNVRFNDIAEKYNAIFQVYEDNTILQLGVAKSYQKNNEENKTGDGSRNGTDERSSSYDSSATNDYTDKTESSASTSTASKNQFKDTPRSSTASNYVTNQTDETGNSSSTDSSERTNASTGTRTGTSSDNSTNASTYTDNSKKTFNENYTETDNKEQNITLADEIIKKYLNVITLFVNEFNDCFMGLLGVPFE